mgnify:CR=1 FL=1
MGYDFVTFGRTKLYYIDDDFNINSGVIDIIQPVNPNGSDSPDDIFVVRHKEAGSQNEYNYINLTRKDIIFDYEDAKDILIDKLKKHRTKFGVGIDTFLGDVDVDGNYILPTEPAEINLAGVKTVGEYYFYNRFINIGTLKVIANDIINVGAHAFEDCFSVLNMDMDNSIEIQFDNLEKVESDSAFKGALSNRNTTFGKKHFIQFLKLKKISGAQCFAQFASDLPLVIDEVFPALEEIAGNNVMTNICKIDNSSIITYSKVKKITGATTTYQSVFGGVNAQNTIWNFPSATEFTGYIWNTNASYVGEIHFAAANQAAIEACDGYTNKWGFKGATIYFDL